MSFLLTLHGEFRWLVALAGAAVLVRSLGGWIGGAAFRAADRVLVLVWTILLDLNLSLGIVLLVALPGGLSRQRIVHGATMLLAVALLHLAKVFTRAADDAVRFRNNFLVSVAVLVLIVVGVLRLRGGWLF